MFDDMRRFESRAFLLLLAAAVTILYAQKHRHVSRQDDRTLTVDLVVCGLAFLWELSVCLSG